MKLEGRTVGRRGRIGRILREAVLVAVELVLESGAVSAEHVLNVLARLSAAAPPQAVETALTVSEAPTSDTGRYDSLRGSERIAAEEVGHA